MGRVDRYPYTPSESVDGMGRVDGYPYTPSESLGSTGRVDGYPYTPSESVGGTGRVDRYPYTSSARQPGPLSDFLSTLQCQQGKSKHNKVHILVIHGQNSQKMKQ